MTKLKHLYLENHPYFITTNTKGSLKIFSEAKYAKILLSSIYFGREKNWFLLLSFVIMPEHLHMIIVPLKKNISQIIKSIKGYSARAINSANQTFGPIWQEGFYDYVLDNENKILTKINYIEENPIRRDLASFSELYPYSSANKQNPTDLDVYFR